LLLKALLLDPVCDSVRATERIIDTMLKKQARYLPQFK
jgi:alpha-galactosidase/6-phospho-beta-glucosidase family protein